MNTRTPNTVTEYGVAELSEQDAVEIAGLRVVAEHTRAQAAIALDAYAAKIWQIAQSLAGLTTNPITIEVSKDWTTLDYSERDGNNRGEIQIIKNGNSIGIAQDVTADYHVEHLPDGSALAVSKES